MIGFETLSALYTTWLFNSKVLLENPYSCFAVSSLRLFSLTLLSVLAAKAGLHWIVFRWLRHRFPAYSPHDPAGLHALYREAARACGLRRLPPLHRFADRRPLAFAIGVFRPVIFVAPEVVRRLPEPELRAALVHELAHVRRLDNVRIWVWEALLALIPALIVQLFAIRFVFSVSESWLAIWSAIGSVVLFRVLLWRPLQAMREWSCDDATVAVTRDPLTLAASLVSVSRLGLALPAPAWTDGLAFSQALVSCSNLERRVRRLLDYRPPRWRRRLGSALRIAALAVLLLVALSLWGLRATDVAVTVKAGNCDRVAVVLR